MIINKYGQRELFVFSTFVEYRTLEENIKAFKEVKQLLIDSNIKFKIVKGCYKDNKELSFVVMDIDEVAVMTLCRQFNQESCLWILPEINGTRYCHFLGTDDSLSEKFKLIAVSKKEATKSSGYTYCPKTRTYYITQGVA